MPRPAMRSRLPFFRFLVISSTRASKRALACFFGISFLSAMVAAICLRVTVGLAALAIQNSFESRGFGSSRCAMDIALMEPDLARCNKDFVLGPQKNAIDWVLSGN